MKRITKRIMSAAVAVMLVFVMMTGCVKHTAGSLGEVASNLYSLEKYTSTTNIVASIDGTSARCTIEQKSNGEATSISISAFYGGFTFDFDDVIVYTDDTIYIGVAQVLNRILPIVAGSKAKLEDFGINYEYVSFTCDGAFAEDSTVFTEFMTDIESVYSDYVTKNSDGTYVLTIDSFDTLVGICQSLADCIRTNSDKWATTISEKIFDSGYKDAVKSFINSVAEIVARTNPDEYDSVEDVLDELDNLYTEYDDDGNPIEGTQINIEDIYVPTIEEITEGLGYIADTFDEITTPYDEYDSKDALDFIQDFNNSFKLEISGKQSGNSYELKLNLDAKDLAFEITSEAQKSNIVSINIPSDDITISFADAVDSVVNLIENL